MQSNPEIPTNRILVIEDEYLVAREMECVLSDGGFSDIQLARTELEALKRIEEGGWDAAVADANLNGRGIDKIAAALREKEIPFVVVTGYGRESLPQVVSQAPVIEKPFEEVGLVDVLRKIVETRTN